MLPPAIHTARRLPAWCRVLACGACLGLAGCGCHDGPPARDADVAAHNRQAEADALARAGLSRVAVTYSPGWVPYVERPTVLVAPAAARELAGKRVLVFPQGAHPDLVRDRAGKIHELDVQPEIVATRGGRLCGCGPNATGGSPPAQLPSPLVVLDASETYGGPVTVVARNWIELAYTYPDEGDRGCSEIP